MWISKIQGHLATMRELDIQGKPVQEMIIWWSASLHNPQQVLIKKNPMLLCFKTMSLLWKFMLLEIWVCKQRIKHLVNAAMKPKQSCFQKNLLYNSSLRVEETLDSHVKRFDRKYTIQNIERHVQICITYGLQEQWRTVQGRNYCRRNWNCTFITTRYLRMRFHATGHR